MYPTKYWFSSLSFYTSLSVWRASCLQATDSVMHVTEQKGLCKAGSWQEQKLSSTFLLVFFCQFIVWTFFVPLMAIFLILCSTEQMIAWKESVIWEDRPFRDHCTLIHPTKTGHDACVDKTHAEQQTLHISTIIWLVLLLLFFYVIMDMKRLRVLEREWIFSPDDVSAFFFLFIPFWHAFCKNSMTKCLCFHEFLVIRCINLRILE